jgi:hypothetical protein
MKVFETLGLAIVMAAMAVSANAQEATWTAKQSDKTLSALVERWAQIEGRHAKWEASADFPISNVEEFNGVAKLSDASSMSNAVERLLKTLSTTAGNTDGKAGPKDVGYFACVYDQGIVAVVIRSQGQQDCSKPL